MSKKPFVKLCMNCAHSKPETITSCFHKCFHPIVQAHDAWALSSNNEGQPSGVNCLEERRKHWPFGKCGMRGRLWEVKP